MVNFISEEEKEFIKQKFEAGLNNVEIGELVGRSKETIRRALKKMNLTQRGNENPNSLYTEEEVRFVCKLFEKGMSIADINRKYPKFKRSWLSNIKCRSTWKEISSQYNFEKDKSYYLSYDDNKVHEICSLLEMGLDNKTISERLEVPTGYISQIRNKKYRKDISDQYEFSTKTKNCKYSDKQVHDICRLIEKGLNDRIISKKLKISRNYIRQVRIGKFRQDISEQYKFPSDIDRHIYSDEQVHEICRLIEKGLNDKDISKELKVPKDYVNSIRHKKIRKNIADQYNFLKGKD